ncbi:hypothetical protein B0O44_105309 [Pedobacter nutrimenti]|uniref:Uncharacterized protein n=2 Tax=Pedobacter nutrimenti TaxID=1241337 RepID=A0A318UIL2_9SPHI|nr:hypothetical protein B0O44_105309 [Pedobacter nutrimenti]
MLKNAHLNQNIAAQKGDVCVYLPRMLTRLTAILLIFCSISANLSNLFIEAGFEMNQAYIARELCVNKDKPQLHCNGKCYLLKKLKQAEEKEQKQERQAQKNTTLEALVVQPFLFRNFSVPLLALHIPLCTGIPQSAAGSVFHPPRFGG